MSMSPISSPLTSTALLVDDQPISCRDLIDLMRRQAAIPRLLQEWVLDQTLADILLPEEQQQQLLNEYRTANQLTQDEAFQDHLQRRHIDEPLLQKMLNRPYQVVQYREERWGPAAESLYLKRKEDFDTVTYQRLQAADCDVMQEIYFRLKDGEESWESLARQFPGAGPDATAVQGPVAVSNVEAPVLAALRASEPGQVPRPIQVGDQTVVVALEDFQASAFDETLRTTLLRETFESWLQEECTRMLERISFPS